MDRLYIVINSDYLDLNLISTSISQEPTRIINIGDKKKYGNSLFDYNSIEYDFPLNKYEMEESISSIIKFIRINKKQILNLLDRDKALFISVRFVLWLDKENIPSTFFDTNFIKELAEINANLDIDMYHDE